MKEQPRVSGYVCGGGNFIIEGHCKLKITGYLNNHPLFYFIQAHFISVHYPLNRLNTLNNNWIFSWKYQYSQNISRLNDLFKQVNGYWLTLDHQNLLKP